VSEIDTFPYSLADVIKMTGLSERSIRRHIKHGLLSGVKVGGVWRFNEENLKRYFSDQTMMNNIVSEASLLVKKFLKGDYERTGNHKICTIIDVEIESMDMLNDVRQRILDISNTHKGINMKFFKKDDTARFTLIGDADYIGACLKTLEPYQK